MIRDMDINHPLNEYKKVRNTMTGIWNKKSIVIQELHASRTAFAFNYSPDECSGEAAKKHHALNLRSYEAIEAAEELLKDKNQQIADLLKVVAGDKVPDAPIDSHPYFRLYRLGYHRHLATKKQMSEANSVIQEALKECEKARRDATAQAWRYYDQIQELTALIVKMGGRNEIRT